ncbi:L-threonine ammonia-lyase [Chitinophaga ginsengisegetis]|uniref:L-threonine dehydratase n=1 Tax=Chitinophaga ginsengisegetis TaxID=393003 RepID=A0A1T5NZ75_9BACT|nr:threonine ammonia-lyase IlvA [Chitinophaga ginsengisegetis]MDR6567062.1 threonine dehydratase [Chitinophaga ginsengisegetis]MDR6646792.1 threonine dehydratase [Chitinophaga ginsengisegetis]MDR6653142.1 threonine dehydratase [Chitinophaga ginsengisegetis]SKD05794.1 L-threonine ammonia-lyase [Chitinophaga ginsengisegetis]
MSEVMSSVNSLNILDAAVKLKPIVTRTPLMYSANLSRRYNCDVYLKREDMQIVRSYKLRGAYNLISSLPAELLAKGVTCASAGNHAQGFAYACKAMNIKGVVFMPVITPKQKVNQVNMFGGDHIEIRLVGDTFDDCSVEAQAFTKANSMTFIPPFDNPKIIEGQGTVAVEILEDQSAIDFLFVPVGGGGLAAGLGTYFKTYSPNTRIIGVEPEGAPSMLRALENGGPVTLDEIERFVDGAAVKRVGTLNYEICKDVLDKMHLVPEGKVCSTILRLYNEDAIVVEPAGALSIAALDDHAAEIKGKKVVCVISGSNNDIDRMQEIKERSLLYEGLKHYFIVRFAQRPGALKQFVNDILGPDDDITRFEYIQKHNKEIGPALVGVELRHREDYDKLIANCQKYNFQITELNKDDSLFGYLV